MTDKEMEFAELLKQAEAGDVDAMFKISSAYKNGKGVDGDSSQSFKWVNKAANEEHPPAMFKLSVAYEEGKGVAVDIDKSIEWLEKAANKEYPQAMYKLAEAYEEGKVVPIDIDKSIKWLEKAANENFPPAMFMLAGAYEKGKGVVVNIDKSIEWLEKAANKEYPSAMFNLSVSYRKGEGVEVNNNKSIEYLKKAADLGCVPAMLSLGLSYVIGDTLEKDVSRAIDILYEVGNKGDPLAYAIVVLSSEFQVPELSDKYRLVQDRYFEIYFPYYREFKKIDADLLVYFADFLKVVMSLENKHLYEAKNNKKLYHYTSQMVINKILNENEATWENKIRLYMASYLNDPTEGQYIFDFQFEKYVNNLDKIRNSFEVFSLDKECVVGECNEQIYSLSFSENSDNLNLWRAYGRGVNGEANGINIAIPYETLKQFNAISSVGINSNQFLHLDEYVDKQASEDGLFLLYVVKYGQKAVKSMWKEISPSLIFLIDKIDGKYKRKNLQERRQQLLYCIYLAMTRLMYLYKHDSYQAEQEVRALRMGSLTDKSLLSDERSPARLYFNTPAILFQHQGSEITLGPQMSGEERAVLLWALRKRIVDLGLANKVTIKSSKAPFR